MRFTLRWRPWRAAAAVALAAAAIAVAGCGGPDDNARLAADTAATLTVRRVAVELARNGMVSAPDLDALKAVHVSYPDAASVRDVLARALQAHRDWPALEQLITARPEAERTPEEQTALARVHLTLGRYAEATRILGPMADAAPGDVELNGLAGRAWFLAGDRERARTTFDRVWDQLVAARRVDEMAMRALIAESDGDRRRAAAILEQTLEIDPQYGPGHYGLSRVWLAEGDRLRAEQHLRRAEEVLARQTLAEAKRMGLADRARDLERAWAARDYVRAIPIVRDLLPHADPAMKVTLYQHLGQAYQALGREAEAKEAFAEAARLQVGKGSRPPS